MCQGREKDPGSPKPSGIPQECGFRVWFGEVRPRTVTRLGPGLVRIREGELSLCGRVQVRNASWIIPGVSLSPSGGRVETQRSIQTVRLSRLILERGNFTFPKLALPKWAMLRPLAASAGNYSALVLFPRKGWGCGSPQPALLTPSVGQLAM